MSTISAELIVLEDGLKTLNDPESQDKSLAYCTSCLDYSTCCLNIAKKCHPKLAIPREEELLKARELSLKLILASNISLLFSGKLGNTCYYFLLFITAVILFGLALPLFVVEADTGHMAGVTAVRMSFALLSLVLVVTDIAVKVWAVKKNMHKGDKKAYNISGANDNKLLSELIKTFVPDILRLQASELILYAVVICNIATVASGRYYAESFKMAQPYQKFEFAGLIISLFLFATHTLIVHLVVIIKCIISLERLRRGKGFLNVHYASSNEKQCCHCITKHWNIFSEENGNKNCRAAFRGFSLQILYVFHIFFHIVMQVLCMAAIWAKVTCENPLPTASVDLYISPFTWVIIVLGFVLPNKLLASLTFFVSVYSWANEYSLSLLSNVLNLLSKTSSYYKDTAKAKYKMIDETLSNTETHCCEKFMYPLMSPLLSIFSSAYYIFIISFPIFMFIGVSNPQQIDCIDPSSYNVSENLTECFISFGWIIFCMVAIALVWSFNCCVINIGIWWVIIVPLLVISIIALVLEVIAVIVYAFFMCFICIIFGIICIGSSDN